MRLKQVRVCLTYLRMMYNTPSQAMRLLVWRQIREREKVNKPTTIKPGLTLVFIVKGAQYKAGKAQEELSTVIMCMLRRQVDKFILMYQLLMTTQLLTKLMQLLMDLIWTQLKMSILFK